MSQELLGTKVLAVFNFGANIKLFVGGTQVFVSNIQFVENIHSNIMDDCECLLLDSNNQPSSCTQPSNSSISISTDSSIEHYTKGSIMLALIILQYRIKKINVCLLNKLIDFLKPWEYVIKRIQSSKTPSIHIVAPSICIISSSLETKSGDSKQDKD
ncbi:unnamed protein product [Rotaria sp. Silwood1]|nr:unnamed protein product [Rotaria sp. Silwood1]